MLLTAGDYYACLRIVRCGSLLSGENKRYPGRPVWRRAGKMECRSAAGDDGGLDVVVVDSISEPAVPTNRGSMLSCVRSGRSRGSTVGVHLFDESPDRQLWIASASRNI